MTNDKSGVSEIGKNSGANAMADENPVNDYGKTPAEPGPREAICRDSLPAPFAEERFA